MACLEHYCTQCDWYSCDNEPTHGPCPVCGAPVATVWDEVPERDRNLEYTRDEE